MEYLYELFMKDCNKEYNTFYMQYDYNNNYVTLADHYISCFNRLHIRDIANELNYQHQLHTS